MDTKCPQGVSYGSTCPVQEGVFGFPAGNQLNRIIARYAFLTFFPCRFARFKRRVVHPAAGVQRAQQGAALGGSGKEAVLERFSHGLSIPLMHELCKHKVALYPHA